MSLLLKITNSKPLQSHFSIRANIAKGFFDLTRFKISSLITFHASELCTKSFDFISFVLPPICDCQHSCFNNQNPFRVVLAFVLRRRRGRHCWLDCYMPTNRILFQHFSWMSRINNFHTIELYSIYAIVLILFLFFPIPTLALGNKNLEYQELASLQHNRTFRDLLNRFDSISLFSESC